MVITCEGVNDWSGKMIFCSKVVKCLFDLIWYVSPHLLTHSNSCLVFISWESLFWFLKCWVLNYLPLWYFLIVFYIVTMLSNFSLFCWLSFKYTPHSFCIFSYCIYICMLLLACLGIELDTAPYFGRSLCFCQRLMRKLLPTGNLPKNWWING